MYFTNKISKKFQNWFYKETIEGQTAAPWFYGIVYYKFWEKPFVILWCILPFNFIINWGLWIQQRWLSFRANKNSWVNKKMIKAIEINNECWREKIHKEEEEKYKKAKEEMDYLLEKYNLKRIN